MEEEYTHSPALDREVGSTLANIAAAALHDEEQRQHQKHQKGPDRLRHSSASDSPATLGAPSLENEAPAVCVIVCFQDLYAEQKRSDHLRQFVPWMEEFLEKGKSRGLCRRYKTFIIEQSNDGNKFNRGKLLNIGFDIASEEKFDVFIFHDVDLLPAEDLLEFYCALPPAGKPCHIARVWDRYNANPKYMGGIVAWNAEDYKAINGYPNNYWGWGGEDDEMMRRCVTHFGKDFHMTAPTSGTLTDLEKMDLTEKLGFLRKHSEWKNLQKNELEAEHSSTWKKNGLSNLKYEIVTTTSSFSLSQSSSSAPEGSSDVEFEHTERVTVNVLLNGTEHGDYAAGRDYMPQGIDINTAAGGPPSNKRTRR